jgi:rhodanese-related sulfurtransferase
MVPDHAHRLVFYCNGPNCTKSQKAARAALALGYANVVEYNEGLPAWRNAKGSTVGTPLPPFDPPPLSAPEVDEARTRNDRPLLMDVRDRDEFDAAHIPGTINVPLDELTERVAKVPAGRAIVLIDHSGHQVPIAARVLYHAGRGDSLRKLDGGLLAWEQKKLPMAGSAVTPAGTPSR